MPLPSPIRRGSSITRLSSIAVLLAAVVTFLAGLQIPLVSAVRPGEGLATCAPGVHLLGFSDALNKTSFGGFAVAGSLARHNLVRQRADLRRGNFDRVADLEKKIERPFAVGPAARFVGGGAGGGAAGDHVAGNEGEILREICQDFGEIPNHLFGIIVLAHDAVDPSLGVDVLVLNRTDKGTAFRELCAARGIDPQRTAAVGDDLQDLPLLLACGLSFAVADAVREVREMVDHVLSREGGRRAVREMVELLLDARGAWQEIVASFRDGR